MVGCFAGFFAFVAPCRVLVRSLRCETRSRASNGSPRRPLGGATLCARSASAAAPSVASGARNAAARHGLIAVELVPAPQSRRCAREISADPVAPECPQAHLVTRSAQIEVGSLDIHLDSAWECRGDRNLDPCPWPRERLKRRQEYRCGVESQDSDTIEHDSCRLPCDCRHQRRSA